MLALVATKQIPGRTSTDHDAALDGELVTPVVLDCDDPHCDVCARAWLGLVSHGGTTAALVVELPDLDETALRRAVHGWLDRGGVIDGLVQAAAAGECDDDGRPIDDPVMAVDDLVSAHVDEIREVCDAFGEGAIVSRLGSLVSERATPRAA